MKIKNIMYNVQDWNVLHNNSVRPVICEDCAFNAHVENTEMTTSFNLKGKFCSKN